MIGSQASLESLMQSIHPISVAFMLCSVAETRVCLTPRNSLHTGSLELLVYLVNLIVVIHYCIAKHINGSWIKLSVLIKTK